MSRRRSSATPCSCSATRTGRSSPRPCGRPGGASRWPGSARCSASSSRHPLSLLAARGFGPVWLRNLLRGLFSLIRAVPEIIIAIVILSVDRAHALHGSLALALNGIGTLGKWGYEAVEAVPRGPIEAAHAAGGSTLQVLRWGVWPTGGTGRSGRSGSTASRSTCARRPSSASSASAASVTCSPPTPSTVSGRRWVSCSSWLSRLTMLIDAVSGAIRRRIMEGARARVRP
ncbi:ABC transporter permease subunit [Microbacterium sp. NRRL B-14842]|uniref:PhnE/PtxC family ABC transporter permease n=1 Tax=Microbacterium sp. NRRL B-14842 TaxID=3162881 RepID=UPI003D2DE226